jgi:hypothetical protein
MTHDRATQLGQDCAALEFHHIVYDTIYSTDVRLGTYGSRV